MTARTGPPERKRGPAGDRTAQSYSPPVVRSGIALAVELVRPGALVSLAAMAAVTKFTIGCSSGRLPAACLFCRIQLGRGGDAIGAFALVVTSPGNATIVSVAGICNNCAKKNDGALLASAREFLSTQVPPSFRIRAV